MIHRLRLMRGRDAGVERWGSLLHQLFEANPTQPHRHVARLFIRDAGLGGSPSEAQEDIIFAILLLMVDELQLTSFCKRGSKRQMPLMLEQWLARRRGIGTSERIEALHSARAFTCGAMPDAIEARGGGSSAQGHRYGEESQPCLDHRVADFRRRPPSHAP